MDTGNIKVVIIAVFALALGMVFAAQGRLEVVLLCLAGAGAAALFAGRNSESIGEGQ